MIDGILSGNNKPSRPHPHTQEHKDGICWDQFREGKERPAAFIRSRRVGGGGNVGWFRVMYVLCNIQQHNKSVYMYVNVMITFLEKVVPEFLSAKQTATPDRKNVRSLV